MKYRKLRIAWSVAWGMFCLALIALWVRSYWWYDNVSVKAHGDRGIIIRSLRGYLNFEGIYKFSGFDGSTAWGNFRIRHVNEQEVVTTNADGIQLAYRNMVLTGFGTARHKVYMPHWFPAVEMFTLAAAPWLRLRFSLRTLLFGMTVAALGLGWIVYAMRG